jgi:GNAT superfamily N-acetyltransferase
MVRPTLMAGTTRKDTEMRTFPLALRELGFEDGAVLDTVFAGLSTDSRFRRFHGAMPRMSAMVRDRLTAVDGRRHLAVAAFARHEPVGIARLITVGPGRAELAVEVVDAWQGLGVGSRLVRAVVERGRSVGIIEIVADVLGENTAMLQLLVSLFPDLDIDDGGAEITCTASLRGHVLAAA